MASSTAELPAHGRPAVPATLVLAAGVALATVGAGAALRGDVSAEHARLLADATRIVASGRLEAIGFSYPPLPVLAATIVRSPVALAVLGAACGAGALEVGRRALVRRGYTGVPAVALLASIAAAPPFVLLATRTLGRAATLFLLVAALDGFRRFTVADETVGGFTTGILLGVAFFVDFTATAYLAAALVAALVSARARHDPDPFERVATVAVLAFPVLTGVLAWGYLEWLFTGQVLRDVARELTPIDVTSWAAAAGDLAAMAGGFARVVAATPVFLAVAAIRLQRDRMRAVGVLVPLLAIPVAMVAGFAYPPALAFSTLALLAVAYLPRRPSPVERWLLVVAAVTQIAASAVLLPGTADLTGMVVSLLGG